MPPIAHDVIVIGGGSAGYAAARTARTYGADVAIVDHGPLGGLCILRGCMPSKTILRSAEVMALMRRAEEFGLASVPAKADLNAIIDRKARLVDLFAEDRIQDLKDPAFTLYQEPARFHSPYEIQAGDRRLTAKQIIVATGSVPRHVPIPGLEEAGYLISDEVLELRRLPESLVVLGGGPVAVEFAQFFARVGSRVTLIQRSGHILSHVDEDLARPVEARFRDEGIAVYTETHLTHVTVDGNEKTVHFTCNGKELTASGTLILQALGRRPNVDTLDLQAGGVETTDGHPLVTDDMRTSQPHIYAVGDVTNLQDIVHIAIQQGEVAGYNATHPGRPARRLDERLVLEVVFTDPQVASLGLGEKTCRDQGIPYLVASHPFEDHGKALCLGETYGQAKLLCRPDTGEILGAHITGPEAGDLIHELVAVMYYHGTVEDLARMPHYHPTLAEILTYPAEALAAQLDQAALRLPPGWLAPHTHRDSKT